MRYIISLIIAISLKKIEGLCTGEPWGENGDKLENER